jgi:hypothetical protein
MEDYAPANSQEIMLVDQIAVGYWRTIRARRFETAMFDNHLRTKKLAHGKDPSPNSRDDEGCAVILQVTDPEDLQNYFRYDATISRDYYRAIAALEKMQAARRRNGAATVKERTSTPSTPRQATANTPLHSIGFVSYPDEKAVSHVAEPRQQGAVNAPTQRSNVA